MIDCREATRLVLQGEDRSLNLRERLGLRLHLLVCKACPRFVRQVRLMREATGRWRAYRNSGEGGGADRG
jgi:hypothetical protein